MALSELRCLEILLYYKNERSKKILLKYNATAEVLSPCCATFKDAIEWSEVQGEGTWVSMIQRPTLLVQRRLDVGPCP